MSIAPEVVDSTPQSRRAAQREAMGTRVDDIQLGDLEGKIDITTKITSGSIERSITGASTLSMSVSDPDREILQSGLLNAQTRVVIDDLTFRLVGVDVEDRALSLTFEDEIVALLRSYDGFKKANRDKMTRAQFARRLVKEVKEMKIKFIAPELTRTQKIDPITQSGERGRTCFRVRIRISCRCNGERSSANEISATEHRSGS